MNLSSTGAKERVLPNKTEQIFRREVRNLYMDREVHVQMLPPPPYRRMNLVEVLNMIQLLK